MNPATPSSPRLKPGDNVIRAELPSDVISARHARAAVRRALAIWGIADPDRDAELLASELVANAAEHGGGPIGLTLRRRFGAEGERGITCEVTDTSPALPRARHAAADAERGRGMAIVTVLATASGVRQEAVGKTTWFTLALSHRIERTAHPAEREREAGA